MVHSLPSASTGVALRVGYAAVDGRLVGRQDREHSRRDGQVAGYVRDRIVRIDGPGDVDRVGAGLAARRGGGGQGGQVVRLAGVSPLTKPLYATVKVGYAVP